MSIRLITGTQAELDAAIKDTVDDIATAERERLARAARSRLLFLDFDGVINHGEFFHEQHLRGKDAFADGESFDRACVVRLNRLLKATGALVVVSSSWRIGRTLEELREILEHHAFEGEVIGKTPHDYHKCRERGDEIREWLAALPKENERFVVLDDDSDMEAVHGHFVQTKFHKGGLTEEKAAEVVRMFEKLG